MMSFEEFTENVLKEICIRVDGAFQIRKNNVTKNNNVKLTGITVMKEGADTGPCIYLDEFFREYESGGMKFDEIVDEVYKLVVEHKDDDVSGFDVSGFLNWETVRGTIYSKLVNAGQNQEQLKTIPHRMFLDLAVVYYVQVRVTEDESGAILIHNNHMESWGQEEETLYKTAMENMRTEGEAVFVSMGTLIKQMWPDAVVHPEADAHDTEMYILTNSRKKYGAAELLDRNTLRMIADEMGDKFIVLPSSVHECIILRTCELSEYERLAYMVQEVNDTAVRKEERLSYHIYVYSRNEDAL